MKYEYKIDREHRYVLCKITENCGTVWKGRARCSDEDDFDEQKGKHIARVRALIKMKKNNVNFLLFDSKYCKHNLDDAKKRYKTSMENLHRVKNSISLLKMEENELCGRTDKEMD